MIDIYIIDGVEVVIDVEAASKAMEYIVASLTRVFKVPPNLGNDTIPVYFEVVPRPY